MRRFLSGLGSFFWYALAASTGIVLLVLFVLFFAWLLSPGDKKIKDKSVLMLRLRKPIIEKAQKDFDFEIPGLPFDAAGGIGLIELKENIKKAKNDDKIQGIYLDLSVISAGFASLEELRNTLLDFKKSKKFIFAYGEFFDEKAYYIASVADRIFINPTGLIELNGLTSERTFIKGVLEKIEVKPEIFRVGEFKSAVEPFFLDKMSDASRKQTVSYLNSMYDFYLANVAKTRGMEVETLRNISDSMLVRNAESAKKHNIVTDIAYYDEVEAAIKKQLKIEEKDKINFVSLGEYEKVEDKAAKSSSSNKIAVIIASGDIVSGQGDDDEIGSDKYAALIRKARLDKDVKAIVIRINSPGGSALASDVMWREVMLAKKEKPVIASMSDVAASGGYYLAMGCDAILAHPNTITGSIGIFGLLFNAEDFLKNKIGVTTDRVNTGKFSDLGYPTRKFSEAEKKIIQTSVEEGYERFTSKAAEGRKMELAALKKIAEGRVWSGAEAKELGLVDQLGGLEDAIALAAQKAKLKDGDYRVRYQPQSKSFFERIKGGMEASVFQTALKRELGEYYNYFKLLNRLQKMDFVQARMPYELTIH